MPIKKDPYSSPAQKTLGLYGLLLFTGRKYSLVQLAGTFRCSKQTIHRMIEQIQLARGVEVKSWVEEGRKWFQAATPSRTPNVTLNIEDIQRLLLCRDFVWNMLPQFLRAEVTDTIARTTVLLPDFGSRGEALTSFARAHPKGTIDYSKHEKTLSSILRAMREHRICELEYQAHDARKPKTLLVAPLLILTLHDSLYIRCRLEKALANPDGYYDPMLAIQRISAVKVTKRSFEPPADSPAEVESPAFCFMPGAPFRAKVAFSPKAAAYVRERQWSADQRIIEMPDGGVVLELTATSRSELIGWVLSFAQEARLVAPERLRKEVSESLYTMAMTYDNIALQKSHKA